ncbi:MULTISPECIES: hypothetical protein [Sphingobacterium]|uniref:hypothetical protein n=1 Tax=Sphingobacterium TaxID=28453 RepID=UPI00104B7770|nr:MULTISPECIES: hypothetical protein [Sphingobacterium]MCW2260717.1 hypothetical protein [Sphingobacterium kitahiroshimense]TCR09015.1 hypothetical protein EDF67_106180 [Sphingobacterium sp. JUb78]
MENSQSADIPNQVAESENNQTQLINNIKINKPKNMVKNKITAESLIIEKSTNGVASKEVLNNYSASLTEAERANLTKLLRHIKSGSPINFNQRKMRDKGGKDYHFIHQSLGGDARTGYKVIIFEGFDLLLERMMVEDFDNTLFDDLATELAK